MKLFLQGVVALDAVKLPVQRDGHGTSTDHKFPSAVLVILPPLLRWLFTRFVVKIIMKIHRQQKISLKYWILRISALISGALLPRQVIAALDLASRINSHEYP